MPLLAMGCGATPSAGDDTVGVATAGAASTSPLVPNTAGTSASSGAGGLATPSETMGVGASGTFAGGGTPPSSNGGNATSGMTPLGGGTGGVDASPSAAGTTASTGVAGASAGGAPASPGPFVLKFRDDFDTLDTTRWQLMTHSWESNLALFSSESVSAQDGLLSITLLAAPEGTVDDSGAAKPYLGAEVRSFDTLTYGRVRARAKLARGSAVVSSLVTIYTPWPADDWNELDIECLGQDPTEVQFNAMVYTGPPTTAPVATSVMPTQDPTLKPLGFDASADFHVYTIEWTPEQATFSVDDQVVHTWNANISLMKLPQNVLLTIWASNAPGWAGAVDATTVGASATYDWIELYDYAP